MPAAACSTPDCNNGTMPSSSAIARTSLTGAEALMASDIAAFTTINSNKVTNILGFKPKRSIEDAMRDLCTAFKAGKIPDSMTDDGYYNVRTLKKNKVV